METNDSIYFYGINDRFGFMSNFYPCKFLDANKIKYYNSEQYFMYQKCLTFDPNNQELINKILKTKSATQVKKYGRSIKNYDNNIWKNKRYQAMTDGLTLKFQQNEELRKKLLDTGDKILYEASKYDKIWGIGFYAKDAIKQDKIKFGENLLGKCLMDVRNKMK